jgi:hypothetical protein
MPSANRFASLRETVRNHPVIVASSAASAGVLLGAFVVVQLLAPPQPQVDSAGASQKVIEAKAPPPQPAAETIGSANAGPVTTGSAPSGENVASADCEQQTWPHLSRACMEEYRLKNRNTRVISTDKLDKPTIAAIETPTPTPPPAAVLQPVAPPPMAPAVAAAPLPPTTPPAKPATATNTATASVGPPAANPAPTPAPAAALAASKPLPAAETPDAQAAKATRAAAKREAKEQAKRERIARKASRKPKMDAASPAKEESDDDGGPSFASAGPDDDDDRAARRTDRADRSRRIVERWTERDYDVPESRGRGQRRVTVIRRGGGGGLFESLFGD